MKQWTGRTLIALILSGSLTFTQAAGPALGVAIAKGGFQIDGSSVSDNATLFGGTTVETSQASSRLQLNSGARVELSPRSRAKVFSDHIRLEKGVGELASKDYQIEAQSLRIETIEPKTVARVRIDGSRNVMVAAVNGPVRVYNEIGLLVANVKPGVPLAFQPQAAAPTVSERTGCLLQSKEDGTKFILVDQVANITVELRGAGLAENVGNQVKISGTAFRSATPVAGASQVIQVTALEVVARGGCTVVPVATSTAPTAGTTGGISNGAKIGIAVAVVGGAAGGVIAATGGSKSR